MPPRTDEAAAWFGAVYGAIQQIPRGRVTSYAHIAYLVGKRKRDFLSSTHPTLSLSLSSLPSLSEVSLPLVSQLPGGAWSRQKEAEASKWAEPEA